MLQQPFTPRQMFRLKPKTLEKRITAYYTLSGDQDNVIKLVRVLQIRQVLGKEEVSKPCDELIRRLYLNGATEAMKRYCYYFYDYFTEAEWKEILSRLFVVLPKLQRIYQLLVILDCYQVEQFVIP